MTPADAAKNASSDAFAYAVAEAIQREHPDDASKIVDRISFYQQGLARGIHNETWITDNLPEGDPERTKR